MNDTTFHGLQTVSIHGFTAGQRSEFTCKYHSTSLTCVQRLQKHELYTDEDPNDLMILIIGLLSSSQSLVYFTSIITAHICHAQYMFGEKKTEKVHIQRL